MADFDLSLYKGRTGFGIHDEMLMPQNDLHAPGTVDAVLLDEMIKLAPKTAEYLYTKYTPLEIKYQEGSRPALERIVREVLTKTDAACERKRIRAKRGSSLSVESREASSKAMALTSWCHRIPDNFPTPERSTNKGFWSVAIQLFGGTEEELIKKGTDVCTELSRVLCALAQIAGLPARLVFLFDPTRKNWAHAVTEIYINYWAAFDATSNVCYRLPNGKLANAWDLRCYPDIADGHPDHGQKPYVDSRFYQLSAIVNYFIWDYAKYDYSWNLAGPYYKSIEGFIAGF